MKRAAAFMITQELQTLNPDSVKKCIELGAYHKLDVRTKQDFDTLTTTVYWIDWAGIIGLPQVPEGATIPRFSSLDDLVAYMEHSK